MHQPTPPRTAHDRRSPAAAPRVHATLLLAAALAVLPAAARASGSGEEAAQLSAVEAPTGEAPGAADAPSPDRRPRELVGFATDAAVARGLWVSLGETYLQDGTLFVTSATAAYGWRAWEFGGEISVNSSGGVGDMNLWAKYVGWKLGPADVGAGMLASVPTGSGDFEAAPFATGSLPLGPWDLRSSLGYVIAEDFFYDLACLRPIGERIDVRAELSGSFGRQFDWADARFLPGVDVHFVRGDWRILVRLSAGAELHPDPGAIVGLGLVLTRP